MQRMKMAGGMLVGAVVLHVGFMACSANNTTGMLGNLLDGGSRDTGIMGGRDARAQEMPCTQWEVKTGGTITDRSRAEEAGWEPYAVTLGASSFVSFVRRCTAR